MIEFFKEDISFSLAWSKVFKELESDSIEESEAFSSSKSITKMSKTFSCKFFFF